MDNIVGRRIIAEVNGKKQTVRVKLENNRLVVTDWDSGESIIKFRVVNANPVNPIVVISSLECDDEK